MSLDHGGHLTHGAKVNFSGRLFNVVQYGLDPDDGRDRLRGRRAARRRAQAEDDHRRLLRVLARHRLAAVPRDRRRGGRVLRRRHGARRGPGRRRRLPEPGAARRRRHDHDTHKTLRGPRGGLILARENPELHKKLNSMIFPGTQGGPLMHVIAAQGRGVPRGACSRSSRPTSSRSSRTRAQLAQSLQDRGYSIVSGGTDNHLFLLDLIGRTSRARTPTRRSAARTSP